jgi:hypothetical protein
VVSPGDAQTNPEAQMQDIAKCRKRDITLLYVRPVLRKGFGCYNCSKAFSFAKQSSKTDSGASAT